jgi:putative transposase
LTESSQNILMVSGAVWRETVKRARVISDLAEMDHCTTAQVDQAARKLNIGRAMVYRLLARFRESRDTSSLLPTKPGRKTGGQMLKKAQERIISDLIRKVYLSKEKPSVAAVHRIIALECFNAKVPIPSYKAVQSRISRLDPQKAVAAREGSRVAGERFRLLKAAPKITIPLDLVQIDHTLVDIIVVDELERKPVGRPWITLAIDVATRVVLGFHVSFRAPSASSVAMTISHAVLHKEPYLSAHDLDVAWPAYGLPRTLHLDNAKEFRSRALVRGCEQYGIGVVHRPPMTPHYGGHVERLIGTLMGEVHLLPGTTFNSVSQRGDYDSAKHSAMTLTELERWLILQIAGVYHLRPHSALGCAPLLAWQERIATIPHGPKEPSDPRRFYIDFLPFQERTVGRGGLRLFNVIYWHGALGRYVNDGKKYIVKYDPRDVSRVYLLETDDCYLEVPYRDLSHERVSLDEVLMGSRILRATGQSTENQQKLFGAIQRQRELVENAKSTTLKARRQAQTRRDASPKPVSPLTAARAAEHEADLPAEPFPFEIWNE